MNLYLLLCAKKVKDSKGNPFTVYFAYRQTKNEDGTFTDVLSPIKTDKGSEMVAKAIKVALGEKIRKELEYDNHFPYLVSLDDESMVDNKPSFYVTINKDKNKKPILDKEGRRHPLLVIRDCQYESVQHATLTLDDIDNIE